MRGAGEGAAGFGAQPGGEQRPFLPQHLRGGTPSRRAGRSRRTHPSGRRAAGGETLPVTSHLMAFLTFTFGTLHLVLISFCCSCLNVSFVKIEPKNIIFCERT